MRVLLAVTLSISCVSALIHAQPMEQSFVQAGGLYLFGKPVPNVKLDDQIGYLVQKMPGRVVVNDVVYVTIEFSRESERSKRMDSSHLEPIAEVLVRASREIRQKTKKVPGKDALEFNGSTIIPGTSTVYRLDGTETEVRVTFHLDEFAVEYETHEAHFPLNPKPGKSQDEIDEAILNSAYETMVTSLKKDFLVIAGRGYMHLFPMAHAPRVEASLEKIPLLAEKKPFTTPWGEAIYDGVEIDGIFWGPRVVKDFVENQ